MQQKKAHHFVPIVYLKHFCRDGKFYVLNFEPILKGHKAYPKLLTPSQVCFIDNYYSIYENFKEKNPDYSGYNELHIEDQTFKKLENFYGRYLQAQVTKQRVLEIKNASLLCDFILQMKIRNPYYRNNDISKNFPNILQDAVKLVEGDLELTNKYKNIPDEYKKFVLDYVKNDYLSDKDFAKNLQLFSLLQRDENTQKASIVRQAMLRHSWTLLISPVDSPYFITTDNPGVATDDSTNLYYNTRFTGSFKFYFPLSFRYCLLIDGTELDKSYLKHRKRKIIIGKPITSSEVYSINDKLILKMNSKVMAYNNEYLEKLSKININKKHPTTPKRV